MDDRTLLAELRAAHDAAPTRPVDPAVALAGGRRRRRVLGAARAVGAATAVAVVVAGAAWIGPRVAERPEPATGVAYAPDGPGDPADLVGTWRLVRASALGGDVGVVFDEGRGTVWRDCGPLPVVWEANGATILAGGGGVPQADECWEGSALGWVESWARYELDAAAGVLTLRGSDGVVVGTLTKVDAFIYVPEAERPSLDDEERARLSPPAPLPAGVRVPTPDELVGRWVPDVDEPGAAHLQLEADGHWSGHDGCEVNMSFGRWAVDPSGGWLSTSTGGVRNYVWCPGGPAANLMGTTTARVGLDRDELVFYDHDGDELGRLVRDDAPAPSPTEAPPAPDLEAACGGPCEERPNGWTSEQDALLRPILERLREVGSAHPQFVDVGPAYGTSGLVLYWDGPVAPDVQAVIDDAADQGVEVSHKDDHWPGWAREAPTMSVADALTRAGIAWSTIGPHSDRPGLRVQGPHVSTDPALQEAARRIAAHVVGPEIPLTFEPFEGYVVPASGSYRTQELDIPPPADY